MQQFLQNLSKALIQYTPSGLSIAVTADAFVKQQWVQGVILTFLTGCTALWVKFSAKFMEEAEKQAEQRGGTFAQWVFSLFDQLINALRKRITQFWWEVTSDFKGKYFSRLVYVCRNLEIQGDEESRGLKLQRVFVSPSLTFTELSKVSPNLLKSLEDLQTERRPKDIGDFLAAMAQPPEMRRLAILGAPGSGKTTLIRYLTLIYANRNVYKLHRKAPRLIPFLLNLREVYPKLLENPNLSLADLLNWWIQKLQTVDPLKPPIGWVAKQLTQNRCLILLDGLDEVPNDRDRQHISQWVDRQMYEYPETAFILTSRKFGYESARLQQDVVVVEVQPFDQEKIEAFVRNWYWEVELRNQGGKADLGVEEEATQQANALLQEIKNRPQLRRLASNPLLLTMIAAVHRGGYSLPAKRVELYKEICQMLLERRQRAKASSGRGGNSTQLQPLLTADQKQMVLGPLALDLTQRETLQFTEEVAAPFLEERLKTLPGEPLTPAAFLRQLRDVDALIAKEQEGVYEFSHRSFQEYLTAVELQKPHRESILVEVLNSSENLEWWAETMRLYAAQTDVSHLIQAILNQPSFEKLLLACDFLEGGLMSQSAKQALLQKLNEPLTQLDPPVFALASKLQPRYFKLAHYLQTGQWKAADYETYVVMNQVGDRNNKGYLNVDDLKNFPCEDLKILDQLWIKFSEGRFGFSVQKQIWVEVGGKLDFGKDEDAAYEAYEKMSDKCGWRVDGEWVSYSDFIFSTDAPIAHLPGWFGWLGWLGGVVVLCGFFLSVLLSHPDL